MISNKFIWLVFIILIVTRVYAGVADDRGEGTRTSDPIKIKASQQPARQTVAPSRGQLLYENHCRACHESTLHVRKNRRANSPEDVRYWVQRWSAELKLSWGKAEIDDVVRYLNARFYKFTK